MKIFRASLLSAMFLAAIPGAAMAQHPCDQASTSTTIQSGSPYRAQFCALAADKIEAVVGYVDGLAFDLLPVTLRTAQPNAAGYLLYETAPFIQVSRGQHTMQMAVYNRNAISGQLQLGPKSDPFVFSAVEDTPLPSAPSIKAVLK